MAVMELWRRRDLEGTVKTEYVDGNFFTQDSAGNLVGVKCYKDGAEASLSGSVTGYCILTNGETVSVAGTRSGNQASILIPQSALAYPGPLGVVIKLVDGNTITTLISVIVVVYRSKTDTVITPSSQIITDWSNQIAAALQDVEDASAAQDAKIDDLKSAMSENNKWNENHFQNIEKTIYKYEDVSITWKSGGLNPTTGGIQSNTTRVRIEDFIPVIPGRILKITVGDTFKFKLFYYSSNGASSFTHCDEFWSEESQVIFNETDATYYIRIVAGYDDDETISDASVASGNINLYRALPNVAIKADVEKIVNVPAVRQSNSFWNLEGEKAVRAELTGNWGSYNPIYVVPGQRFIVTGRQGNTAKTRLWAVVSEDFTIIEMGNSHQTSASTTYTDEFTVPNGGVYLLCTSYYGSVFELKKNFTLMDFAESKPLGGKRLSLLGDSISAYAGTIPAGNTAYYTGSNSGVSSSDQMWWKILCDNTGMIPLVINGWSGSGINWQTEADHANIVPMSDDTRCSNLHDGSIVPDVILIAGGVNDYSYAQAEQNEPLAWDGISAPGYTEPISGKQVYNSFTEAYVAMIKKLQTNYPNAIVVALSTWFTMRGTDNGYTLTHAVGQNIYTQQDYNDKIRYVAEQMHIPYIDVSNIGFNRNNFHPTYAVDSSINPTHPNAEGQNVMGRAVAEKLVELVTGYFI